MVAWTAPIGSAAPPTPPDTATANGEAQPQGGAPLPQAQPRTPTRGLDGSAVSAGYGSESIFPSGREATSSAAPSAFPPQDGFRYLDRNEAGVPGRWNPCVTHTWSAKKLMPRDKRLFTWVFRQVKKYTGVRFVYSRGRGDVVVDPDYRPGAGQSWSGYAGPEWSWSGYQPNDADHPNHVYSRGHVSVSFYPRGTAREAVRYLFLHEVGHLVGLAHVNSRGEVMFHGPIYRDRGIFSRYQPGDIRGLRAVGARYGCLNLPPAATDIQASWQEVDDSYRDENGNVELRLTLAVSWRQTVDATAPVWGAQVDYGDPNDPFAGSGASVDGAGTEGSFGFFGCVEGALITVAATNANGTTTTTVPAPPCPSVPTTDVSSGQRSR